jgi:cytochrome P450
MVKSYPFSPTDPLRLPAEFAELRDTGPISRVDCAGQPAWLLTRHDDIRNALTDRRLVAHLPGITGDEDESRDSGVLFTMNGAAHTRLRGVLSAALSARRVAELQPALSRIAARQLDYVVSRGSPVDLVADYAGPIAIQTLGQLLGVLVTERAGYQAWADQLTVLFSSSDPEQLAIEGQKLTEFISTLTDSLSAEPKDGLLAALRAELDAGRLSGGELFGLVFSVMGAGYFPAAQAISLGLLRVLINPEFADALRHTPSMLPAAADELLRLDPSGSANTDRYLRATEDLTMGQITIHTGDLVVAPLGAANRDPAAFPEPDTPRLDRAARHLSFAPGAHHCLGAALARMQLATAIGTIIDGLPTTKLATRVDERNWRTGYSGARNLTTLPVSW